ncbi:hypothetical protein M422DRAFT_201716 [Sphaerobolus stellatus SS14]|nr:hypothetical protein M422DRAFT_201716 [Sphaerobolus stellatus SS14]
MILQRAGNGLTRVLGRSSLLHVKGPRKLDLLTSGRFGHPLIYPSSLSRCPVSQLAGNTIKPQSSTILRAAIYSATLVLCGGISGYWLLSVTRPEDGGNDTLKNPKYGSKDDFDHAISMLQVAFSDGDRISTDPEVLRSHGFSAMNSYHPGHPHSVVVFPESTDDVVRIVHIAKLYKVPVIAYSGGTSLEGQFIGHPIGGICVNLSGMDKIIQINEADSDIVVQAGCQWQDINATLKELGIPLFFPLDPAPGATIGGMIATGCSGTNAVRYGTAKGEWFLNATIVLPSGEVIKTRSRARKSSAGFDLTKLFIGAEGTLGIVTEATLRLAPLLPTTVAVVQFSDVMKATEAVREIINSGATVQCVELLDDKFMQATNKFGASSRKWPEKDTLFIKLQGATPTILKETSKLVQTIAKKHGGTGYELAKTPQEADDLWADRKNAHFSTVALLPGCQSWATDVCVPVSNLPKLVYETKKDLAESGLIATMVGHVGDGNFHAQMIFEKPEELEKARQVANRMVERAIALDGTCTGEHGVGLGKKKWLEKELGTGTVEVMKLLKRTLDPHNLFNPGKLYPDPLPNSDAVSNATSASLQSDPHVEKLGGVSWQG